MGMVLAVDLEVVVLRRSVLHLMSFSLLPNCLAAVCGVVEARYRALAVSCPTET